MAGSMCDYLEDKVLDHCLGIAALTFETDVYVGLFTTDPGEAAARAEVSGFDYARVGPVVFSASSGGASDNDADLEFPPANGGAWGEIGFWVIFDAATVGNRYWHGTFDVAKTIADGDTAKINAGELDISLD